MVEEKVQRVFWSCMLALTVIFWNSLAGFAQARPQTTAPLKLIQTIEMPGVPVGPYTDHLDADVKGQRVFATPQAHKSVQILDLKTGNLLHEMTEMGNAHAVLYRGDLDRIYVIDSTPGLIRIYDGKDYHPIQTVEAPHADSMIYDPVTKLMYVTNPSDASNVMIIDTTTAQHSADINIGGFLEAMAIEKASPKMYVDVTDKNQVAVLDRQKRAVLAKWPLTKGREPMAMALDEQHHRLYIGCRDTDLTGSIVVLDTQTGNEIAALPIGGMVDYLAFDQASGRIYASCGTGSIDVYKERDPDHYDLVGTVGTAIMAKTGLFVPELNRYLASVPHIAFTPAKIMVFQIQ